MSKNSDVEIVGIIRRAQHGWVKYMAIYMLFNLASPAMADGETPPFPIEPRTFKSFAGCKAYLESAYRDDRQKADPAPVNAGDGKTQTLIDSEGPVVEGPHQVSYEVTEGWKNRTPSKDWIMTTYSYRRTKMRCDGRKLTGESYTGYNLEGYERLPGK
ncbi:hypothetical protein [Burkholderia gladioli]|uniref:hypothetical protein n=1 Tax=Burkholderia gladioli TaxID=28095 RepID=UPI002655FBD6|nr:hypothetical protein [Burkholderia gladioli]MDN7750997.1 hypothetical protein [Burkholderia gladioli]